MIFLIKQNIKANIGSLFTYFTDVKLHYVVKLLCEQIIYINNNLNDQ